MTLLAKRNGDQWSASPGDPHEPSPSCCMHSATVCLASA